MKIKYYQRGTLNNEVVYRVVYEIVCKNGFTVNKEVFVKTIPENLMKDREAYVVDFKTNTLVKKGGK